MMREREQIVNLAELESKHWSNGRVYVGADSLGLPVHVSREAVGLNVGAIAMAAEVAGITRVEVASWSGGFSDIDRVTGVHEMREYRLLHPNNYLIAPYAALSREGESAGIWLNTNEIVQRVDNGIQATPGPKPHVQAGLQSWYDKGIFDCLEELLSDRGRYATHTVKRLKGLRPLITFRPVF